MVKPNLKKCDVAVTSCCYELPVLRGHITWISSLLPSVVLSFEIAIFQYLEVQIHPKLLISQRDQKVYFEISVVLDIKS